MKKRTLFMLLVLCLGASLALRGQPAWQPTKSPRGYEVLFLYANDKDLYAGLGGLGLFRSADRGETWTRCDAGIDNRFPSALLETKDYLFAATLFGGDYQKLESEVQELKLGPRPYWKTLPACCNATA